MCATDSILAAASHPGCDVQASWHTTVRLRSDGGARRVRPRPAQPGGSNPMPG